MARIAVIGLGLIGGSLGLALKGSVGRRAVVVGWDRDAGAVGEAYERGAIDEAAAGPEEVVRGAALVVIATPVMAMPGLLRRLARPVSPGAIVTDTGSTKLQIVRWAEEILPSEVPFVGGHPMAGREVRGIAGADPGLFRARVYCLTPTSSTPARALETATALASATGATPRVVDPSLHDEYVAGVSHLPTLLSVILVNAAAGHDSWEEASALASSGFHDVSRLASGDPVVHRDLCMTNAAAIEPWLERVGRGVGAMRRLVREAGAGEGGELLDALRRARELRERWVRSGQPRDTSPGLDAAGRRLAALLDDPSSPWSPR